MPYLIDGHNLIPKIPRLSLQAVDDELQLVELLQEYCRRRRKQVEVYFDSTSSAQTQVRRLGTVVAHFVRQGRTADEAIRARLARLGRNARNYTVISSDQAVQAAARAARARYLSAEAFADDLATASHHATRETGKNAADTLSAAEVQEWLDVFGATRERDNPDNSNQ